MKIKNLERITLEKLNPQTDPRIKKYYERTALFSFESQLHMGIEISGFNSSLFLTQFLSHEVHFNFFKYQKETLIQFLEKLEEEVLKYENE
jgi:hypothetical protein